MKLVDTDLKIILDSRGEETLEAELTNEKITALASVHGGKSRGAHEAFVLGPKEAVQRFKDLRKKVLGREFNSQEEFDNFLISLDGTHSASSGQALKKNLGGNLILALSLAWAQLKAKSENLELFRYIRQLLGVASPNSNFPRPIFNIIEGGV